MGCPPSRASTQPTSAARLQAAPTTDRGRASSTPDRPPEPGGNLTGVTTLNTELAPKRRRNTTGRGNHGHLAANQICRHYRQSIVMPLSPAVVDKHVAFFNIASFAQTPAKGDDHVRIFPSRPGIEKPDHRYRCRRNVEAEQFRRLQIDYQLELRRLDDREVAGLLTFENAPNVNADLSVCIREAPPVTLHQVSL